jgi:hypothetical protein
MSTPNCSQCRHFYITWNAKTPNGCRRFGIESKDKPSTIVAMAGLGDCQGFEAKKRQEAEKKGLDLNRKDLW